MDEQELEAFVRSLTGERLPVKGTQDVKLILLQTDIILYNPGRFLHPDVPVRAIKFMLAHEVGHWLSSHSFKLYRKAEDLTGEIDEEAVEQARALPAYQAYVIETEREADSVAARVCRELGVLPSMAEMATAYKFWGVRLNSGFSSSLKLRFENLLE